MRWALATLIGVSIGRQEWRVRVNETAPSDCRDTFSGFRRLLNITTDLQIAPKIKSTVIRHLIHQVFSPSWSDVIGSDDTEEEQGTRTPLYTADLLGVASWINNSGEAIGTIPPTEATSLSAPSDGIELPPLLRSGAAVAESNLPPLESTAAAQLYEHDKLMGRQTLDRLKETILSYFNKTGLVGAFWPKSVSEVDDADSVEEYLSSVYVENLLNQIIKDTSLSIFPNISLTIDSAFINLGDALCKTTQLSQGLIEQETLDLYTCATHSILEMGLTCNARDIQIPDCNAPKAEQSLLCDIPELGIQNPFDPNFIFTSDIQPTTNNRVSLYQGNLDRWLLRAVSELYRYTKYDVVCRRNLEMTLGTMLPGWKVISDIWLDYSGILNLNQTQNAAPFSILLKNPNQCDFVVVNRGSVFKSDWLIDFDYELVDLVYHPENFPKGASPVEENLGKLSKGYESIAQETSRILYHQILYHNCTKVNSILFTGHSMGGIIGAAQALLLSSLYSDSYLPKLSVVSFGAPSAIDLKFKELVDQRATVRGWNIELDAVTKIPCENPLPNCDQVEQNLPLSEIDRVQHYTLPNTITIENRLLANLMPTLGERSFGSMSYNIFNGQLDLDRITFPGTTLFAQTHTCAYTCWMNAAYCSMTSAYDVCTACINQ